MTNEEAKILFQNIDELESSVLAYIESVRLSGSDERWLSIGQTDIQKGFMSLRRGLCGGKRTSDQV